MTKNISTMRACVPIHETHCRQTQLQRSIHHTYRVSNGAARHRYQSRPRTIPRARVVVAVAVACGPSRRRARSGRAPRVPWTRAPRGGTRDRSNRDSTQSRALPGPMPSGSCSPNWPCRQSHRVPTNARMVVLRVVSVVRHCCCCCYYYYYSCCGSF